MLSMDDLKTIKGLELEAKTIEIQLHDLAAAPLRAERALLTLELSDLSFDHSIPDLEAHEADMDRHVRQIEQERNDAVTAAETLNANLQEIFDKIDVIAREAFASQIERATSELAEMLGIDPGLIHMDVEVVNEGMVLMHPTIDADGFRQESPASDEAPRSFLERLLLAVPFFAQRRESSQPGEQADLSDEAELQREQPEKVGANA